MRSLSAPSVRWAVPVAVLLAVGVGAGGAVVSASAAPELPPRTAAQLLVDLQGAQIEGMSGTVVQHADLGLPELPVPGGGQGSAELTSLISGSHTLRVWYGGHDTARIALLGTLGESDVIRNGSDLWIWSSEKNSAVHRVLPDATGAEDRPTDGVPLTPRQAARRALDAVDPSTAVSVDGTAEVAGRHAYELVLDPRDSRSLVGQVRIAVDARQHVPLRVRVLAAGHTKPAVEVGFTHVSFDRPDPHQFRFSPPPGATVTESTGWHAGGGHPNAGPARDRDGAGVQPEAVGAGWTRVLVFDGVSTVRSGGAKLPAELGRILSGLPHVHGAWGSGRLLRSPLFTALLTDDGRLVVGMVGPELIYRAAADR